MRSRRLLPALLVLPLAAACGGGGGSSGGHTSSSAGGGASSSAAGPASPTHAPKPPPVFPLTGLPSHGSSRATLPALSVKIDNAPDALPQSDLNLADIVSEQLVEGGLTRLMATYQSQAAPLIGPIRSIRPVDAQLVRELGRSILAFSGGAAGEIAPSASYSHALLLSNDALSNDPNNPFYRVGFAFAPHNVYSSTARLYGYALKHSRNLTPPPQLFSYGALPAGATAVHGVRVVMSGAESSSWAWDARKQLWLRTQDGRLDVERDGQTVSTNNVVVLSVSATPIPGLVDAAHNHDQFIQLVGAGAAWVFRNGHLIRGHWVRPSVGRKVRLLTASGAVIPLQPGRTFIELQPRPNTPAPF